MNTQERNNRILNCGKGVTSITDSNGIEQLKTMYCGYYFDCEVCFDIEKSAREQQVISIITKYDGPLFRAVVQDSDWDRLRKKMGKAEIKYIKVPRQNGESIVYASNDPGISNLFFVETDDREAIDELTAKENLFTVGKRSSSRDWPLRKKAENDDSETVTVVYFYPFLTPPKGEKFDIRLMNKLKYFASTWTKEVTLQTLQEYIRHKKNKYIELASAFGYKINLEKSSLAKERFSENEISNWSINVIQNNVTDKNGAFLEEDAKLYTMAMGITQPKDYMQAKLDSMEKDALGDLYDYFYPSGGGEYDSAEQAKLNTELPY